MKEYRLTQALGGVSDELLLEASQIVPKRRIATRWRRLTAVAAAVAIFFTALVLWPTDDEIITGPGLFVVRAYAADENGDAPIEGVVLEEGVKFAPNVRYDMQMSFREHFPFEFSVDESLYAGMELTVEVNTNAGIFYKMIPYTPGGPTKPLVIKALTENYGQHFTVGIDEKMYWEPCGFDYDYLRGQLEQGNLDVDDLDSVWKWHLFEENPSFIDVIIRADDHVIGFCVIEIREKNGMTGFDAEVFSFEVITIVGFPQVDGKWQKVTLKYVQELIGRIHLEREELS